MKAALKLLDNFQLKGKILTADAGFCYKNIAESIIKQKGEYVFALKGNQPTVFQAAEAVFAESAATEAHATHDHGHGRDEIRIYQAKTIPHDIQKVLNWPCASSFVKVLLTRKTKAKTSSETRFLTRIRRAAGRDLGRKTSRFSVVSHFPR